MPIAVHPSGRAAGAEITGFNLATDLNDANFAVIQGALDEHGVIYLRNTDPPIWYDTDVKLFEIQRV